MTHDEIVQHLASAFENWLENERAHLRDDAGLRASDEQVAQALELAAKMSRERLGPMTETKTETTSSIASASTIGAAAYLTTSFNP